MWFYPEIGLVWDKSLKPSHGISEIPCPGSQIQARALRFRLVFSDSGSRMRVSMGQEPGVGAWARMIIVHPAGSHHTTTLGTPPYTHPVTRTSVLHRSETIVSWGSIIGPHLSRLETGFNILRLTGYNLIGSVACCMFKN